MGRLGFATGLLLVLVCLAPAQAERMYVIDELVVAVRSQQDYSSSIVGRVKSTDSVEVKKRQDDWSLIQLADGTEGWIQTQYLSSEPPSALRARRLETETTDLRQQVESLQLENSRLQAANDEIQGRLQEKQTALDKIQQDYEKLGREEADYTALKEKYEQVRADLAQAQSQAERLGKAADENLNRRRLTWFIAGGGVLLAGWLAGLISSRRRRSSSRLY